MILWYPVYPVHFPHHMSLPAGKESVIPPNLNFDFTNLPGFYLQLYVSTLSTSICTVASCTVQGSLAHHYKVTTSSTGLYSRFTCYPG